MPISVRVVLGGEWPVASMVMVGSTFAQSLPATAYTSCVPNAPAE